MSLFIVAIIFGALGWLFARSNYRGIVQDLRETIAHERKMRRYEEERAESLSDALFGRVETRTRRISGMQN